MVFILGLCSALGLALHNVFMARYYRSEPATWIATLRGLSLGITMLPLLLFTEVRFSDINAQFWFLVFASGFFALLANSAIATAARFLPVGFLNAFIGALLTILSIPAGFLLSGKLLEPLELLCIALLTFTTVALGVSKSDHFNNPSFHFGKGIFFTFVFAFFTTISFSILVYLSRLIDPYFSAYAIEFSVGVIGLIFLSLKRKKLPLRCLHCSPQKFLKIAFAASPVVVGTGCLAVAVTRGPYPIVMAVQSTMIVMTAMMAIPIYQERPSRYQWVLLLGIVAIVGVLKLIQ